MSHAKARLACRQGRAGQGKAMRGGSLGRVCLGAPSRTRALLAQVASRFSIIRRRRVVAPLFCSFLFNSFAGSAARQMQGPGEGFTCVSSPEQASSMPRFSLVYIKLLHQAQTSLAKTHWPHQLLFTL